MLEVANDSRSEVRREIRRCTYEDILLEITQQQDQLRRSTPVIELPATDPSHPTTAPAGNGGSTLSPPAKAAGGGQITTSPQGSQPPGGAPSPQPAPASSPKLTPEEQQARIDELDRQRTSFAAGRAGNTWPLVRPDPQLVRCVHLPA